MQTKIQSKLVLNKQTIAYLQQSDMAKINGGFTYSLSTGDICKNSNDAYDNLVHDGIGVEKPHNGYDCRAMIEDNGTSTLSPEQIRNF